jgi:hypothetical protein
VEGASYRIEKNDQETGRDVPFWKAAKSRVIIAVTATVIIGAAVDEKFTLLSLACLLSLFLYTRGNWGQRFKEEWQPCRILG